MKREYQTHFNVSSKGLWFPIYACGVNVSNNTKATLSRKAVKCKRCLKTRLFRIYHFREI